MGEARGCAINWQRERRLLAGDEKQVARSFDAVTRPNPPRAAIQPFQRPVNISCDLEFVVFRDSLGEWRWRLMNKNHNAVLAFGATSFKTCEECVNAIYIVMGAHSASIRDACTAESAAPSPSSNAGSTRRTMQRQS